jgi:hypothetical protein
VVKIADNEERITQKLDLPTIHTVVLDMPANVIITASATQFVEVEAQATLQDLLKTEVVNGVWQIGLKQSVTNFSNTIIRLGLPTVVHIKNFSTGSISYVQGAPVAQNLSITSDGTGEIEATINIKNLTVRSKSIGQIKLSGTAQIADIENTGLTAYNAFDLQTETCRIVAMSSGKSQVNVKNTLDVSVSGMGDVFFKGRPTITKNITGQGKLVDAN